MIELAQLHLYGEVERRLRVDAKTVSKVVEQFRESGSTAPKPLNHTRTVSKCSFQDSMHVVGENNGTTWLFMETVVFFQLRQFPDIFEPNCQAVKNTPVKV